MISYLGRRPTTDFLSCSKTPEIQPSSGRYQLPEIEKFDHLPKPHADAATAFVSIMEGCSKILFLLCCAPIHAEKNSPVRCKMFCLKLFSLPNKALKKLLFSVRMSMPTAEKILTVNLLIFALLLEYVAEIEGIERIRYTTSHPKEFSKRLIEAYGKIPKLANHVHLPVQAGSDRVLAGMKRGYTVLEYKSIVRKLRQIRPDICIATDFIVGFPNETAEDFEKQ